MTIIRKNRRFTKRIDAITQHIQEAFPIAFPKKPAPKLALKIGIKYSIMVWAKQFGYNWQEIDDVLFFWCKGKRYEEALATGKRYDLEGNEVVSDT